MDPDSEGQRDAARAELVWKLRMEGERKYADELDACGRDLPMRCAFCESLKMGKIRCKKRWCPHCQRAIAAERSARLEQLARSFKWPLFLTLTKVNDDDLDLTGCKHLRRSFGKLRHKKIWKSQVKGGAACIEITNIGNGWHPHLHALLDCRWLAIRTPEPGAGMSQEAIVVSCRNAQRELSAEWAKCLGQRHAIVWVKRTHGTSIAREVAKYTVKGSDLLSSRTPIGPLLDALKGARLMTTFGTAFKFQFEAKDDATPCACPDCGKTSTFVPDDVYFRLARR
jgi:hypothetical protein